MSEMRFRIEMTCDSDAFVYGKRAEMARILRSIADSIEHGFFDSGKIRDVNGNHIGNWDGLVKLDTIPELLRSTPQ